jgi:hypothetical protein
LMLSNSVLQRNSHQHSKSSIQYSFLMYAVRCSYAKVEWVSSKSRDFVVGVGFLDDFNERLRNSWSRRFLFFRNIWIKSLKASYWLTFAIDWTKGCYIERIFSWETTFDCNIVRKSETENLP